MSRVIRRRSRRPAVLRPYARALERLKRELRGIGFVCRGSLNSVYLRCGKPSCRCHRGRRFRHGPYTYWTRKAGARTQSRLVPRSLIPLYAQGIRNRRKLDAIIERMQEISLKAFIAAKEEDPRS